MANSSGSSIQAQAGRNVLLKVDLGASPTIYQAFTGLRATQIKINGNQVDITNKNSNGWQELLTNAGVRKFEMTGSGIYDSAVGGVFAYVEKAALNNTFIDAEITFPNGVVYTGTWVVSDYTLDAPYDNATTFSLTLMSHGPIIRSGN